MKLMMLTLIAVSGAAENPPAAGADNEAVEPAQAALQAPKRRTLSLSAVQASTRSAAGQGAKAVKLLTPPEPEPLSAYVQPDGSLVLRHGKPGRDVRQAEEKPE